MQPIYMNELINFLYLSVIGLLISGILLVVWGHRNKTKHWLLSLLLLSFIIYVGEEGLHWFFAITVTNTVFGCMLIVGILCVAWFENWTSLGQITFAFALQTAIGFVMYSVYVTLFSGLGPFSLIFSLVLLVFIIASLILMLAQTFEMIDVICRLEWRRIFEPKTNEDYYPKVSLHVPAYNEPPEMVIETLNALANLDYPNYEVLMVDNNTTDKKLWEPVEAHCAKLGFKFVHLENWPGFKSGALNYAIGKIHIDTEIIGVIDADYIVEPNYLKELVGYFAQDNVAFVQTPQDYRDFESTDKYAQAVYHSYQYFFKMSMATRNERNGIIFTGTMGLIRRKVLEKVGGWDEWCITEDAEIALKILDMGYESIYVDKTYGRGLMPLNFEGLKKQRFRWAFGGMQVLRLHWKKLLPFSSIFHKQGKLTAGQKMDYWFGGLQWFNDPLAFIFTSILLIATSSYVLSNSVFLQPLAGATLFVPFIFIFFGLAKVLWALRIRLQCSLREAYRAFLVLLSLTWVVTLACFLGLTKEQGVFLRTPKHASTHNLSHSIMIVNKEISITLLCLITIIVTAVVKEITTMSVLLCGLLMWQSFIYGSAFIVNRWSNASLKLNHKAYQLTSSKTTGDRFRAMVYDTRATVMVLFLLSVGVVFFYFAIQNAPDKEIAFRTNPLQSSFIPHSLINNPPESFVKALILLEEEAAITKDLNMALALWHEDGEVRDANYTAADESDDTVWKGINNVRRRYREEYRLRTYYSIQHKNISVFIDDNDAIVVNDLAASYSDKTGLKKVYLSKGDRWVLKKFGDQWKIMSLTVNRVAR